MRGYHEESGDHDFAARPDRAAAVAFVCQRRLHRLHTAHWDNTNAYRASLKIREEDIMRRLIVAASVLLLGYSLAHATDPPQIKQASVNGVNLTYEEQGQGKPVVFVPGAVAD